MDNDFILDDAIGVSNDYVFASKGKRFANYIIDTIINYIGVFACSIGYYSTIGDPYATETGADQIISYVMAYSVFIFLYTVQEAFLNGKTIGKFITRTRAITVSNDKITAKDALLRSLSRIVPFEAFSFLGSETSGWHDKWTDTKVVDETKTYTTKS